MTWAKSVLIALDQFGNALLGGWPDETLSSRCWRWEQAGVRAWPRKLVDAIFFWDKNHCYQSFENERTGRQLPPEARPPRCEHGITQGQPKG